MPERQIAVRAWASAGADVDAVHKAMFGRAFRRIGRFVKLAQVGAARCVEGLDPQGRARAGLFLGSGLGNIADLVPLALGVLHPTRPRSSPMTFAGSLGNSASFFVARALDLTGPNTTVSQEELSFEAALLQATLSMRAGLVERALVGGVDVVMGDEAEQRQRLGAAEVPGTVTEGAAFLLLEWQERPRVRLDEVWIGHADDLIGEATAGTVLRGWRCPGEGRDPRLCPVATALRLVDVLSGTEPVDSDLITHIQRDARGLGARVRLVRR